MVVQQPTTARRACGQIGEAEHQVFLLLPTPSARAARITR